jgi:glycosyltransferase involved in cell wall biosynthesis
MMTSKPKTADIQDARTVDLIVPCYNESAMLTMFFDAAEKAAKSMPAYAFRYIFIDDGSTDGTLGAIQDLARRHGRVGYVSFSRNFGKEAAIYAGLKHSDAPLAVVIDADLQHPPELIRVMAHAIDEEGYDSCAARRVSRDGEPRIRSAFSRAFYKLINKMSEVDIVDGAVDYRMMTAQMVAAILELSEVQRFSKGIFSWIGFRTKWIDFFNVERIAGETKWSFWKLVKYALEGITSFTTVPLRFAFFIGLAFSLLSFALLSYELIKTIVFGVGVPGYPSTLIMLLMIGGVMILSTGILGEYVARMYMETKRRPIYIKRCSNIENSPGAAKEANAIIGGSNNTKSSGTAKSPGMGGDGQAGAAPARGREAGGVQWLGKDGIGDHVE